MNNEYTTADRCLCIILNQLSVEREGFPVGTEWGTSTRHRTPPRRNDGEMAVQILLISRPARCGFWRAGTEGGNWKLTLRPGSTGSATESGSITTGGRRIGSWTQRAGRPRAGGKVGKTGLSKNTGLRLSTETTSVLEPIWRQKNVSLHLGTR